MRLKPFSALCYLKENMTRCILLMFMLFLGYGCYLGGLYISNPLDNWQLLMEYAEVTADVASASVDEDLTDFTAFAKELEQYEQVTILETRYSEGMNWNSIMGFKTGWGAYAFCSVEDFQFFCEYLGIQCDFENMGDGSLIISEKMARNKGLEIGDVVNHDLEANVFSEYTVAAITQEDGYTQYYINEGPVDSPRLLVFGNGIDGSELHELLDRVREDHPVYVSDPREIITDQLAIFNIIYMFVVLLLAVILAVTINAAFVGMYQRRNFEFAVYRAIGMGRGAIVKKLVGELLWMDFFALTLGAGVLLLGLYLFNNLSLYPAGKYLRYFHPTALQGLVLCNVMVLLPLIVTRCRQMLRADICEY